MSAGKSEITNPKSEIVVNPKFQENIQMKGKLVIISAPSGAGKTTIVRHLLAQELNLSFSVSATTRSPRSNERDGVDYYFLTEEEFRKRIARNEFVEWEEVYSGILYGTLRSEVDRLLGEGRNVIFDVDVVGGLDLKEVFREDALAVFVSPPSVEALEQRLRNRSSETEDKIAVRIAKATAEMTFAPKFDVVLVNDHLETALAEAEQLVRSFLYSNGQ